MYEAVELARKCGVSLTIVYNVRRKLDLDRLPTEQEINDRPTKRGQKFKCTKNKTSN